MDAIYRSASELYRIRYGGFIEIVLRWSATCAKGHMPSLVHIEFFAFAAKRMDIHHWLMREHSTAPWELS